MDTVTSLCAWHAKEIAKETLSRPTFCLSATLHEQHSAYVSSSVRCSTRSATLSHATVCVRCAVHVLGAETAPCCNDALAWSSSNGSAAISGSLSLTQAAIHYSVHIVSVLLVQLAPCKHNSTAGDARCCASSSCVCSMQRGCALHACAALQQAANRHAAADKCNA